MRIRNASILALAIALCIGLGSTAFASGGGVVLADPRAMEGKHFDPKGKMPSKFTIELQNGLRTSSLLRETRWLYS